MYETRIARAEKLQMITENFQKLIDKIETTSATTGIISRALWSDAENNIDKATAREYSAAIDISPMI